MRQTRATGKEHSARRRGASLVLRPWSLVLGPLSLVVLLAGCGLLGNGGPGLAKDNSGGNNGDPLLGVGAPVGAGAAPAPNRAPAAPQAPASLTSQASLAQGTPVNDRNVDLRVINATGAGQTGAPWTGASSGAGQWSSAPVVGTTLRQPEAVSDAPHRQDTMVQPVSAPTRIPGGDTYEQLQAQLTVRGVSWQQLETAGDHGWKYTCSVPKRQNPKVSRTYEATAATDLAAIRAALDQIGKEQQ
jgi:hypothetical protein